MRKTIFTLTAALAMVRPSHWLNKPAPTKFSRQRRSAALAVSTISTPTSPDAAYISAKEATIMPRRRYQRVTVFDLDTLASVGDVPDTRAAGAAVDAESGHGFATSKPVAMWDTKTLKMIKTIDVQGSPDGILGDAFNHRIYILSHQVPHVTVIDAKER